jgi:hypothetical protein
MRIQRRDQSICDELLVSAFYLSNQFYTITHNNIHKRKKNANGCPSDDGEGEVAGRRILAKEDMQ